MGRRQAVHITRLPPVVIVDEYCALVAQDFTATSYRYEWELFVDWCAAVATKALPADPLTVAGFLSENPAGESVQVRRVAAINQAHRAAGLPVPGSVTALRLRLRAAREQRIAKLRTDTASLLTALPISGWTSGLFGRRDAVLLMLAGAGLTYTDISNLDRTTIDIDGKALRIGGHHWIELVGIIHGDVSYIDVWRRWQKVLTFVDRYPSTNLLTERIEIGRFPDITDRTARAGPVAVPIDRWGSMPLPACSMSPAAIADVIGARLAGTPTPHRKVTVKQSQTPHEQYVSSDVSDDTPSSSLSDDYYDSGIAARRTAHATLADIPELFDGIEEQAEQLLQRMLDLLENK